MKLLNLTGLYYTASITVILAISGVLSFQILKSRINNQFNRQLASEREQLIYELKTDQTIRESYYLNVGDRIELEPIGTNELISPTFSDTVMYDVYARADLRFRRYQFSANVDGQNFRISIFKSLLSTEELVGSVGEIMLVVFAGLMLSLLMINRYLSNRIWRPFYEMLEVIRSFDITRKLATREVATVVDEFKELNLAVEGLLQQIHNDYLNLKEFNENSSHEIQTPLAIIQSKAELLLQSDKLNKEQLLEVKDIYDTTQRLSRVNQSLLQLTKIENHQYLTNTRIKLSEYLKDLISTYNEIIEARELKLTLDIKSDPELIINKDLAYMLFSNLINNAIKHSQPGGSLQIRIHEREILFMNTGQPLLEDPMRLFERFKKGTGVRTSGPGLGLALVKKICDLYEMKISYSVRRELHKISITL